MKTIQQLILSSIAILALSSCQEVNLADGVDSEMAEESTMSTYQEAIRIASEAATILDNSTREVRTITASNAVTPIYSSNSREGDDDPSIYAVNYDDNQGFAIISAKNTEDKILGVFDSGTYEEASENPSFEFFVESAANYVDATAISEDSVTVVFGYGPIENTTKRISPKVQVMWGQNYPYGMYCPNKIAGCTNTALAQIMSYYKYPTTLGLTYSDAASSSITLDWNEMVKHTKSNSYYNDGSDLTCCGSSDAHDMIASLIRELGNRANSDYSKDNTTTTYYTNIPAVLTGIGYTVSSLQTYTTGIEQTELKNGILYVRAQTQIQNGSGHGWVVDGSKYIITFSKIDDNYVRNDNCNYAHVNWGWNGIGNGYYLSNVFDTSKYYSIDDGCNAISSSDYNFSYNVYYYVISR